MENKGYRSSWEYNNIPELKEYMDKSMTIDSEVIGNIVRRYYETNPKQEKDSKLCEIADEA